MSRAKAPVPRERNSTAETTSIGGRGRAQLTAGVGVATVLERSVDTRIGNVEEKYEKPEVRDDVPSETLRKVIPVTEKKDGPG